jgi:hypothetical protein
MLCCISLRELEGAEERTAVAAWIQKLRRSVEVRYRRDPWPRLSQVRTTCGEPSLRPGAQSPVFLTSDPGRSSNQFDKRLLHDQAIEIVSGSTGWVLEDGLAETLLLCGTGKRRQAQRIPGSVNWALVAYTSPPKSETPALLDTYARSG